MSEQITVTDEKKLLSALGLCSRARRIAVGVPMICEAMRKGGKDAPRIVFEASDTSENTHKRISDKCGYYGVRLVRLASDGAALAAAVGKRSSIGAVSVADGDLCRLTEKYIQTGQ